MLLEKEHLMFSTSRPRIPNRPGITYTHKYQASDMSSSSSSTINFTAASIPANWAVTGVRIRNLSTWTGVSLAGLTIQVGNANLPSIYASPYELTGTILSTSQQCSGAFAEAVYAADNIIVRFVASGCAVDAITTGSVEVSIRIEPL